MYLFVKFATTPQKSIVVGNPLQKGLLVNIS